MSPVLAVLLALAAERVVLVDEVVRVPPGGWRAVDLALKQRPAIIECKFTVADGRSGVRVALLRREDVGRFRSGQAHRVILSSGFERAGRFRYAPGLGQYALLIDNRLEGRGPAQVRLEVVLEFGSAAEAAVRELSPGRRLTVIAITLVVFSGLVWFAARRLRRAVRADEQT